MNTFYGYLLLLICISTTTLSAQNIQINEFLASNVATNQDPNFQSYSDWIELYNPTATPVYLSGYFLSDDKTNLKRWTFPSNTQIPANGYLMVWADGKNTGLHTNFKLEKNGEFIALSHATGAVLDSLSYTAQTDDISYGRIDTQTWRYFSPPTPNALNPTSGFEAITPKPQFNITGGFYSQNQTLSISTSLSDAQIHYTLDGTPPTANATLYHTPLVINKNTVVRAAVFKEGWKTISSKDESYFINEAVSLPVVSLITDPKNFYDNEIGIYVQGTNGIIGNCKTTPHNWNQDWERPVHIEFFESNGAKGFDTDAGVKIFGGCSRIYPMKSLSIHFRDLYGNSDINYPLFANRNYTKFKSFVLRSSAQDWYRTMFRDGMIQTVILQNMRIDGQAYRPSLVFLNGEFFGIHNIREKLNEDYLKSNYPTIDHKAVDILETNGLVNEGSATDWNAFKAFLATANLAEQTQMDYVTTKIEVDNYLEYVIAEIYIANSDWPAHNISYWKEQKPEGKWRWLLFDTDFGFGGNGNGVVGFNTLEWATAPNSTQEYNLPWSTLLLRKLLENPTFKANFIQRMMAHAQITFEANHVVAVIDSLQNNIRAEIPRHKARWSASLSFDNGWENAVEIMRNFARQRYVNMRNFLGQKFGMSTAQQITFASNDIDAGHIEAETLTMPYKGIIFFQNQPITVKAVPKNGYRFIQWEGVQTGNNPEISFNPNQTGILKAIFEPNTITNTSELPPVLQLSIFPNPASQHLSIAFQLPEATPVSWRIVDILGREIEKRTELIPEKSTLTLDTSKWAKGTYIFQAKSKFGSWTEKLLLIE